MPKIDMSAAPNVSSLVSTRRATGADFGGGQGLLEAGQAITQFGEELKRQNDRATAVEIEKNIIDAETEMMQKALQLEESAEAGAPGHVDNVTKLVDEYAEKTREAYSTASSENRQRLELSLARMRRSQTTAAARFQAKSQAVKVRSDAEDGLNSLLKQVADGSRPLDEAMQHASDLIDATGLQGQVRSDLMEQFTSDVAANDIGRMLREADTPQEVAALRDDAEKLRDKFSPEMYERVLGNIDKAEERLFDIQQAQMREDLKNTTILAMNGKDTEVLDREDFLDAYDSVDDAEDAYQTYQRAVREGEVVRQVNNMSISQVNSHREALEARANNAALEPEEQVAAIEELQRFDTHLAKRQRKIDADPVKFVLEENPELEAIYSDYAAASIRAARSGDEADRAALEDARDKYVDNLIAAQNRLGVSEFKVLPATKVTEIETAISSVAYTAEGAGEVRQILGDLQAEWGEHWPTVYRQLVNEEAIDPAHAQVARLVGDVSKNVIVTESLEALAIKKSEYKNLLPNGQTQVNDTENSVRAELNDFTTTLNLSGGNRQARQLQDAVSRLALYKQSQGMSMSDAVAYATKKFVLDDYDVMGTYRIPKNPNYDAETITRGASALKRDLSKYIPRIIPSSGISPEDEIASIQAKGEWRTKGDETGLVLVDEQNRMIELDNGKVISFTWAELQDAGVGVSVQTNRTTARQEVEKRASETERSFSDFFGGKTTTKRTRQ